MGNSVCDAKSGCNITTCLWDGGDCGDGVLSAILAKAGLAGGVKESVVQGAAELISIQGGYVKEGLYFGLLAGLTLAVVGTVVCCKLRASRKRAQMRNSTYTPYGNSAVEAYGVDEGDVPRLESAADEEED